MTTERKIGNRKAMEHQNTTIITIKHITNHGSNNNNNDDNDNYLLIIS